MLYSCTHMATVGVKGLTEPTRGQISKPAQREDERMIFICYLMNIY